MSHLHLEESWYIDEDAEQDDEEEGFDGSAAAAHDRGVKRPADGDVALDRDRDQNPYIDELTHRCWRKKIRKSVNTFLPLCHLPFME